MLSGADHLVLPPSAQPLCVGELMSVRLNEKAFFELLSLCKYSLIARMVLPKRDQP